MHIEPADLLIQHTDKTSSDCNITTSDLYRIRNQLKETFLENIESIFMKYRLDEIEK